MEIINTIERFLETCEVENLAVKSNFHENFRHFSKSFDSLEVYATIYSLRAYVKKKHICYKIL